MSNLWGNRQHNLPALKQIDTVYIRLIKRFTNGLPNQTLRFTVYHFKFKVYDNQLWQQGKKLDGDIFDEQKDSVSEINWHLLIISSSK